MKIQKEASAVWQGTLKEGSGKISTQSGALNAIPYGFNTRFAGEKGTNPEELLGAAHAGCFTMAFSMILDEAGFRAETMETKANVTLEKDADGFEITGVQLTLRGNIPGIDQAQFEELANKAKVGCPLSKVLKAPITLDAQLGS